MKPSVEKQQRSGEEPKDITEALRIISKEKEYSRHLKRMVIFLSISCGYSIGCLLFVLIILLSTKI